MAKRRRNIGDARTDFLGKVQDRLSELVRQAENLLFGAIDEFVITLDVDGEGRIKQTAKNYKAAARVQNTIRKFNRTTNKGVVKWILDRINDLLGLNKDYFNDISGVVPDELETVEAAARRQVMARLGFDTAKNSIIKDGYLYQLTNGHNLGQEVGNRINSAIASRMSLADFRKDFKDAFTSPSGLGLLERYYYTKTFDIFQQYDRGVQLEYADRLNMGYAIYTGTRQSKTKKTAGSRQFCIERIDKVYTREEIENWKNLSWKGKTEFGYNPFTDCGGYNCRHHLSWISDELAAELRK